MIVTYIVGWFETDNYQTLSLFVIEKSVPEERDFVSFCCCFL